MPTSWSEKWAEHRRQSGTPSMICQYVILAWSAIVWGAWALGLVAGILSAIMDGTHPAAIILGVGLGAVFAGLVWLTIAGPLAIIAALVTRRDIPSRPAAPADPEKPLHGLR